MHCAHVHMCMCVSMCTCAHMYICMRASVLVDDMFLGLRIET